VDEREGDEMDVRAHNRDVWDGLGSTDSPWTRPVGPEVIAAARRGEWQILLTPSRPVPATWFPPLAGCRVLCLAGGGGQQGPVLAAAGAVVTVLDFSAEQLRRDREVAEREGLELTVVQGDMTDLSMMEDGSFDLVVHPVSNVYVPEIAPVWREAARVLRTEGVLMAGFMNPVLYIFDQDRLEEGEFVVRHPLPYSELTSLTDAERQRLVDEGDPLQFSHTWEEQVAGQLAAGFLLTDLYEDRRAGHPLAPYVPTHVATRAVRARDGEGNRGRTAGSLGAS
jgi:SAM-dependent methyltransferase